MQIASKRRLPQRLAALGAVLVALTLSAVPAAVAEESAPTGEPVQLSAFGERPNFSPDGNSVVFVGAAYGDAYKLDLATREVHNITADVPHQGVVRIQYLASGDYLVTAPHRNIGANSRAHLQMWGFGQDHATGFQGLGETVLEGIAVSRHRNLIAWTTYASGVEVRGNEPWQAMFTKPTQRFVADVEFDNGVARLTNKREIMPSLPPGCMFTEPQDFRDNDRELLFSCLGTDAKVSVMGYHLDTGAYTVYRQVPGEYTEIEGLAPDGSWGTVECKAQGNASFADLKLCRLDLTEGGEMRPIIASSPKLPGISNPVVHPDGKHLAFQTDDGNGDIGEGMGIWLLPLTPGAELAVAAPATDGDSADTSTATWIAIGAAALAAAVALAVAVAVGVRTR